MPNEKINIGKKTIFDFCKDEATLKKVFEIVGVIVPSPEWYKSADEMTRYNHIGTLAVITENKPLEEAVNKKLDDLEKAAEESFNNEGFIVD